MPHTHTYASLLTRLFSGNAEERSAVLEVLEVVSEADRLAVEPEIRARLRDSFPWLRLIAAEAVLRVYRDIPPAVEAVASVLKCGDPALIIDATELIQQFGPASVPLLVLMVRHTPDILDVETREYQRWAADVAVRSGPEGLTAWLEMFGGSGPDTKCSLLIGLANAVPAVSYDLSPLEAILRAQLALPEFAVPAGAALWRTTWRINRDWLSAVRNWLTLDTSFAGLRELVVEVLIEHLGRRPDLADILRRLLAALSQTEPTRGENLVTRLARLGSLGWAVLIPMLHPNKSGDPLAVPDRIKRMILQEALGYPGVWPLLHHHAHGIVALAVTDSSANELVPDAVAILSNLGPVAGMAIPDLLNLAVRLPSCGWLIAPAVLKLAPGFPNTASAVTRTLNRIRTHSYFGSDHLSAFESLAVTLGQLDPDAGPALAEVTAIDPRTADLLLQQPPWRDAAPETRTRHVRTLADGLLSARPEVRLRAAELLRHYRAELPAVWPALVAVLAGRDEKAAIAVLPHFKHLGSVGVARVREGEAPAEQEAVGSAGASPSQEKPGSVADAVAAELLSLCKETNSAYAARAVVALWRLGRMSAVGSDLRTAVETATEDGWGWGVLRGVVNRVSLAHGMLADLSALFAASPAAVAEKVNALFNPPESPEEAEITRVVPRPGDPTAPETVDWDALQGAVGSDGISGLLLFVALMCEYGSTGCVRNKIWMIKNHREMTRVGLAESKMTVERVMATVEHPATITAERQRAVRDLFAGRTELPPEVVALLEHRLGWFRWAGLELADAWGLSGEQVKELTTDRIWDTSSRVRERALRMVRG